jgi:hypothetical protein
VAAQLIAGCAVAALRTAFLVQASVPRPTSKDSVVKYLEEAFDELEACPLRSIT